MTRLSTSHQLQPVPDGPAPGRPAGLRRRHTRAPEAVGSGSHPMVADGKSSIVNDPWAMPNSGAGTKAPQETTAYDENSYETRRRTRRTVRPPYYPRNSNSPGEAHHQPQVRVPSAGQHADQVWAKSMQKSPRTTEAVDATRNARSVSEAFVLNDPTVSDRPVPGSVSSHATLPPPGSRVHHVFVLGLQRRASLGAAPRSMTQTRSTKMRITEARSTGMADGVSALVMR